MPRLGIMQPYFFPYLGYFQAIHAVDKYVLYGNLNYIKEAWVNRNRLLAKNARPFYIVVPVVDKKRIQKIKDVRIAGQRSWRGKILNALRLNYARAKWFGETYELAERVINCRTEFLSELNCQSIIAVSEYLGIPTEIVTDTDRYAELEAKLADEERYSTHFPHYASLPERMVLRVFEVCRMEGATRFVNAIGGQELYSREEFAAQGIDLKFVQTLDYHYGQQSPTFYRDLSIIDVLMNCGKEQTRALLENYALV